MDPLSRHLDNLCTIFPLLANLDSTARYVVYTRIRKLEAQACRAATDYCNKGGDILTYDKGFLAKLDALIGFRAAKVPVHMNWDPRGYAFKIDDSWLRAHEVSIFRDMGGYGIIAPTLA